MRIDSHQHFWTYDAAEYEWIGPDMSELRRDFLPEHLIRETTEAGIDGVVSVQARPTVGETRCLLDYAGQHDFVQGIVGWVPLASPELEAALEACADSQWLKAVRHVVQDEPDDNFLLRADFNRGISSLNSTDATSWRATVD